MLDQNSPVAQVLVTGDFDAPEFASLFNGRRFRFESLDELLQTSNDQMPLPISTVQTDLIVIAQPRPRWISQMLIDQIRNSLPTVPVVVVLGSWCEGETRSGQPIEGIHRVYWHKWHAAYELFTQQLKRGEPTLWHRPVTETRGDWLSATEFVQKSPVSDEPSDPLVIVSGQSRVGYLSIRDVCQSKHWRTTWLSDGQCSLNQPPAVAVIDSEFGVAEAIRHVVRLREQYAAIPIVILAGFVRRQDLDLLPQDSSKCQIVSKPFDNLELIHAIESATKSTVRNHFDQVA